MESEYQEISVDNDYWLLATLYKVSNKNKKGKVCLSLVRTQQTIFLPEFYASLVAVVVIVVVIMIMIMVVVVVIMVVVVVIIVVVVVIIVVVVVIIVVVVVIIVVVVAICVNNAALKYWNCY
jgi:hypothetical protein